jgi:hypothetical protein
MHSSSGSAGSGTGFGPISNIKCNTKVTKSKLDANLMGKRCCFWHWKGKIFYKFFVVEKLCKISLDPELELEPEPQ